MASKGWVGNECEMETKWKELLVSIRLEGLRRTAKGLSQMSRP